MPTTLGLNSLVGGIPDFQFGFVVMARIIVETKMVVTLCTPG
jgi:hypothetical protein